MIQIQEDVSLLSSKVTSEKDELSKYLKKDTKEPSASIRFWIKLSLRLLYLVPRNG
jgi:hypothetical protein